MARTEQSRKLTRRLTNIGIQLREIQQLGKLLTVIPRAALVFSKSGLYITKSQEEGQAALNELNRLRSLAEAREDQTGRLPAAVILAERERRRRKLLAMPSRETILAAREERKRRLLASQSQQKQ